VTCFALGETWTGPRLYSVQTTVAVNQFATPSTIEPRAIERGGNVGGPARIRTLDQRIMSSPEPTETEEDKPLSPAKQGKVRQKPQPGSNRDTGEETA
jgi:hypothetical protein